MILAHEPSRILATLLVADSFGGWADTLPRPTWSVGMNKNPEDPAVNKYKIISVFDRKADQNSINMHTGERGEFWGWQILVRGMNDGESKTKAFAIANAFDLSVYKRSIIVDASTYVVHRIRRTMPPVPFKQEEKANMRIWTMEGFVSIYYEGS